MKVYNKFNIFFALCGLMICSCKGFLDLKPDAKMVIPKALEDCELLLNDYSTMNMKYPGFGEVASDNYYLTSSSWSVISDIDERNIYVWSNEPVASANQWQGAYKTIYQANQILSVLEALEDKIDERWKVCNANAHFFRAFALHQLMNVFTLPYNKSTSSQTLGLPIKLTPDLDEKSVRANLEQTCQQIINDYLQAVRGLPLNAKNNGLPNKAAAYAGLARLYLGMQNYDKAYLYADSSLTLNGILLDYNSLNANANLPFQRFNQEVLFPAVTPTSYALGQSYGRIDTMLLESYAVNDLRKELFFRQMANGMAFKGSYDNSLAGLFVGLTSSEMYLIRAEAAIRLNYETQALDDLNFLRSKRYNGNLLLVNLSKDQILVEILNERRKELIFRGIRWTDLKRLNQDSRFVKTLTRMIDGKIYSLEPNSLKYAILIPQIVIQETGMPQNSRN